MGCQIHELAIDWIPLINYSIEGTCPKRRLINNNYYLVGDAFAYGHLTLHILQLSPRGCQVTANGAEVALLGPTFSSLCTSKIIYFIGGIPINRLLFSWSHLIYCLISVNGCFIVHLIVNCDVQWDYVMWCFSVASFHQFKTHPHSACLSTLYSDYSKLSKVVDKLQTSLSPLAAKTCS